MTFLSLKKNIDSLMAAGAGFCIILLFTRHGGIGISPDAVVYASAAQNIAAGGTLADFNQLPVVQFPAFYSLFLGGLTFITGLNPLIFAPLLNALLFGIIIYLAGDMMEYFIVPFKPYKWMLLSCIVLSPSLLEVYSMLWSETIFILMVLIFMIVLRRYLHTYSLKDLLFLTAIVATASVTRFAGITLITTAGTLLLASGGLPIGRKIKHGLILGIGGISLLTVNLIRNHLVSGTLTGIRENAVRTLLQNMHDVGAVFCDWLPFLSGQHKWATPVVAAILLALICLWIRNTYKLARTASYENIAITFFVFFTLFMIASASLSRYEPLNNRLLSPLFIPLLWGISSWLPTSIQHVNARKKTILAAASIALFGCFQYHQMKADYETWDGVKDAGIPGYTEDGWKYGQTVQFIQENPFLFSKGYSIYSNANDAIYFFTRQHTRLLPHKEFPKEIQAFMANHQPFIVWFNDGENDDLIDLTFIFHIRKVKLIKKFRDGAVYQLDD